MTEHLSLIHSFDFEAAHFLPNVPQGHKCRRLHGHSFHVDVTVEGPLDPELGWVMDYADIKEAIRPLRERLDHHHLNEIEGLENPTSENIALWIWQRLAATLPLLKELTVRETCNNACTYRG